MQAWRISWFNRGDTLTTQQSLGSVGANRALKYSVRIATMPDIKIECGTPAGIHTARSVGTTQVPFRVCTVITPRDAYTS